MQNKPENPPAFPVQASQGLMGDYLHPDSWGMSLRDYFAAAALQGIISGAIGRTISVDASYNKIAQISYSYAESMLKAREANQTAEG